MPSTCSRTYIYPGPIVSRPWYGSRDVNGKWGDGSGHGAVGSRDGSGDGSEEGSGDGRL